jgi:hypothetical protein
MTTDRIECPECKRVGETTKSWVIPGTASGVFMQGLDPEDCETCRAVLEQNGYAPLYVHFNDDGTVDTVPIPRGRRSIREKSGGYG